MNIKKPTLYKAQPHHGVVALLTEGAYLAHRESWGYYLKYGSWEQAAEELPELMKQLEARVAAGTFTFVEASLYYEGHPMYRVVHTGSTNLLDEVQRLCTVVPFDDNVPFGVPFSSGDFASYPELLARGYGRHLHEIGEIIRQATEVLVRDAWKQVTTDHRSIFPI